MFHIKPTPPVFIRQHIAAVSTHENVQITAEQTYRSHTHTHARSSHEPRRCGRDRLTVQVQRHRAGDRRHQVVVGGLAREVLVQVLPLEALQMEDVAHPAFADALVAVVEEGVLLPPGHLRRGATCAKKSI